MERQLNNDQASSLRKIARTKGRRATYVSISSGKGGVGKTTLAVNWACILAQMGKKVLVLDADLGLANIDIMLRIPSGTSLKRYLEGQATIEEVLVRNVYGFDLFPASSGVVELAELSASNFAKIQKAITTIDCDYDYILFDTGAGIAHNVHRFAAIADRVVVVTQPEPTAIADAYAFLKSAKQLYTLEEAYVVFNRVDDFSTTEKVFAKLAGVVKKFLNINLISIANLPEDPDARRAVRGQKPLSIIKPDSPFTQGVREMAVKVNSLWPRQ